MIWASVALGCAIFFWLIALTLKITRVEDWIELHSMRPGHCDFEISDYWPDRDAGELQSALLKLCPTGACEHDNQGQIVFYTGLCQEPFGELKLFTDEDGIKSAAKEIVV